MYMILPIAFRHHLIILLICVICFFFFNNLCGNFSKNRQRPQPYVVVNIFYNLFYQCLFFSGKVSERCGEDYLADLEKFGHSWKPIADKTKWTVPEKNPGYYARKCYPGERCVIGYYKKIPYPPGRSETMKAAAGKCVPCEGGQYTDGSLKNPAKCSLCPIGQFNNENYAKSCKKCPQGKHIPWSLGCIRLACRLH